MIDLSNLDDKILKEAKQIVRKILGRKVFLFHVQAAIFCVQLIHFDIHNLQNKGMILSLRTFHIGYRIGNIYIFQYLLCIQFLKQMAFSYIVIIVTLYVVSQNDEL